MLHILGKGHRESVGIEVNITILFKDKSIKSSFRQGNENKIMLFLLPFLVTIVL